MKKQLQLSENLETFLRSERLLTRFKILAYARIPEGKVRKLSNLASAFHWGHTSEKYDYWYGVAKKFGTYEKTIAAKAAEINPDLVLEDKPAKPDPVDAGKHYRFGYTVKVTQEDLDRGFIEVNLDPFRIAAIYGMTCFAAKTILKKVLVVGNRGYKDETQDLKDIISAAERKLQMLEEDSRNKELSSELKSIAKHISKKAAIFGIPEAQYRAFETYIAAIQAKTKSRLV